MTKDNPGVIVFPPLLFIGTLAIGLLLHWLMPRHPLPPVPARIAGVLLLVVSGILGKWGDATMHTAGTNVKPSEPALVVVTGGPFRFSRNPLYLSLAGLYLGVALVMNALWPLLLLLPVLLVTHYGIVRREERYLAAKFGEAYREYCRQVRRWL